MNIEQSTPNHLIRERSPYLQQHAFNPVEWHPWGDEAFEKARSQKKPIFLSIGYSTCHWCHVMERESFESPETAALMNELYVNIKVDREERPDVDQVYMAAAQALTGQGGWPLSAWLTPDLKPYYVGTYFPPRSMYGRPSFAEALTKLHQAWINERERVERSADAILDAVRKGTELSDTDITFDAAREDQTIGIEIARRCFERLAEAYDPIHGGFGSRPKFPRPVVPDFLLRYYDLTRDPQALDMALYTLRSMADGGMYDQLGGGFSRYSVDEEWRVPHFEKMLYDQGQLLAVYADAYRIAPEESLAATIRQTIEYLVRDMRHEEGAFYSAEDADSEGVEGKFYAWSKEELRTLIDDEETFDIFCRRYGIIESGNFEHGTNVLHTTDTVERIAESFHLAADDVIERLADARRTLFAIRGKRIRPHRDEKILTAWNGLTLSGLARASMALGDPRFAGIAANAADFILEKMLPDGRLFRRWKDGEIKVEGHLDDYAFLVAGLIDLYEATFITRYLQAADGLTQEAIERFGDRTGGGFFQTDGADPNILVRSKGDYDGAEPSGNSVMAMNLIRLGRLFGDDEYTHQGERTTRLFLSRISDHPDVMPLMVSAVMLIARPSRQIVIAPSASDTGGYERLTQQARTAYRPDTAIAAIPAEGPTDWMIQRMPIISGMKPVKEETVAYVCENFICRPPTKTL